MMISSTWKDKLKLADIAVEQHIAMGNTFGLFFTKGLPQKELYLIPLNDTLAVSKVEGLLLCFGRELIEEDDVEYALDVLNLFNLTSNQQITINDALWEDLHMILRLIRTEHQDKEGSYLIVKSALKILLLKLIRYQRRHFLNQDLQQKRVYSFLQLMEQHFKTHTDGHFYAERLGISTKRLNQILQEKLGLTASQILQQRRITEIKRELQSNNKTLKEIAFTYNFNSAVTFSRFFKRLEGISAQEFRKHSNHS